MYEKILKIAEKIAREIRYEPIYGSRGGDGGVSGGGSSSINWILITGTWEDFRLWIDTENWID